MNIESSFQSARVCVDPMVPIHLNNLRDLYIAALKIALNDLSDAAFEAFPMATRTSYEAFIDWRDRYNVWFACLSEEDAKALSRGLVMSGAV